MKIEDFRAGSWEKGYEYSYFHPTGINHPFQWESAKLNSLLETASLRLGELNSFSRFVPGTDIFISMHVLKEAVTSSKIEGTQTNMEEALISESDLQPEKRDDWLEVQNYIRAMDYAIKELERLPISTRLLKKVHAILLESGRGEKKTPGEIRLSQNWIGGAGLKDATFIPPAHELLPELLSDFEKFINNRELALPDLIRVAIAHYQFETIHPFLDGNGRVGRLLITLYLVSAGILERPLLYLSDFFERNKRLYYDNLMLVREKHDLLQWLKFFLVGVIETAGKGTETLKKVVDLKTVIEENHIPTMGRRIKNGSRLLKTLFQKPIVSVRFVEELLELSPKAAGEMIALFEERSILKEMTGNQRNRLFVFEDYLRIFHE